MRPSLWRFFLVSGISLAASSVALAQGQLPGGARPGTTAAPPQAAAQPTAPRGTTVAVIDIKFIFDNHARFKDTMDKIKKDYDAFETQVRGVEANLRQQLEKLKTLPAGSNEYKQLETQIATTRTQVQLDINNRQKERVEEEAKVYHNAFKELEGQIQQFAARYGIDLVLQYSRSEIDPSKPDTVIRGLNRLVVYQDRLDITDNILQEVNRSAPIQQTVIPPNPQPRGTIRK